MGGEVKPLSAGESPALSRSIPSHRRCRRLEYGASRGRRTKPK